LDLGANTLTIDTVSDAAYNAYVITTAQSDTTEAGSGEYTMQFSNIPYTLSRGGITDLGSLSMSNHS